MFAHVDLGRSLTKEEYQALMPGMEDRLYAAEQALFDTRIPVLVLCEGWAGTSKVRTIARLTRRLDPRGFRVHSVTPPRTSETQYPWLYRFWLRLPTYGQIGLFDRSWYRELLQARAAGSLDDLAFQRRCAEVVSFERQLVDDGAIILKYWFHISKDEQAARFKRLGKDPLTAWQVTEEDRWQNRHYKQFAAAAEHLLAHTDMPGAPWALVPSTDRRFATVMVFETLLRALESRLGLGGSPNGLDHFDDSGEVIRRRRQRGPAAPPPAPAPAQATSSAGILSRVDLGVRIGQEEYDAELARLQARLYLLGLQVYRQSRPVVLVFEGWDAAGKGGAIKRLTEKLDPRAYVVHSIAAPAGDDRERHYLYRFWRRLPPRGTIAIFDRSWYGRVLVERVEGFAREEEWRRAYAEINEFEEQLISHGTIICKFWMHISPEEQLRRFEERQRVPHKAWKLTDEDWRNREKWPAYTEAADEMLLRTSTQAAPWTVIEAEDKRFARIKALSTAARRLESELGAVSL